MPHVHALSHGVTPEFSHTILVVEDEGLIRTSVTEYLEECGYRVLSSRPAEPDSGLSFAGIGDLLADVIEGVLAELPGAQRSALFPNFPTIAESGLPKYDSLGWFGLFAPGTKAESAGAPAAADDGTAATVTVCPASALSAGSISFVAELKGAATLPVRSNGDVIRIPPLS